MKYPKVYLAIDNCFAYKRWTSPNDWSRVIKDLGVDYIEASADTELDPLFMGQDYLDRWINDVKTAEVKNGVKVANLYSGHGTYCTLGLAHTDENVRKRLIERWFKPLIKTAASLEAGLGFFAHAFADFVLQDKNYYEEYLNVLIDGLSELNDFAEQVGCKAIGVEQMYSPHQVPWRINGTKELLKSITIRGKRSFYFTEDVGHHHIKYIVPSDDEIKNAFKKYHAYGEIYNLWLGTDRAYDIFYNAALIDGEIDKEALEEIKIDISTNPHMFSEKNDSDCYEWIRQLGCYSPIIHLQQTDGTNSSHKHFTKENNQKGKINGEKLLLALKESYEKKEEEHMPKRSEEIFLTIEAFTSTASINQDTVNDYKESVEYWRKHIPEDGIKLNKLV